nr:unnamed protein product [Amyelois transitella]
MGDVGGQKKQFNKNKLKKTIKNVLCRPDHDIWPEISEVHKISLEMAISKYKLVLPMFIKPQWKELKMVPKENRPKWPKFQKVDGLLFGIRECCSAIESKQCTAVMIESAINPRLIVQPVIEVCQQQQVPFICCPNLRKTTEINFGIPTSCLGIKLNSLQDLTDTVLKIAKDYAVLKNCSLGEEKMEVNVTGISVKNVTKSTANCDLVNLVCPYLYRSNKNTRIFVPDKAVTSGKLSKDFVGQSYIEFSNKLSTKKPTRNSFKNMMVKRITNNPFRGELNKKHYKK